MPRRYDVAVAVAREAELLLGYHVDVAGVPNFNIGRIAGDGLGLLFPVGDAEVDDFSVLRPLRSARGNNALWRGNVGGFFVGEIAPGEDRVGIAIVSLVAFGAERCEIGGILAPGEGGEARVPEVENFQCAGRGIE